MTRKTRTEFDAEIAASLPNNTAGAITPAVMRTVMDDMTDSVLWYDEGGSGGGGLGNVVGPGSSVVGRAAVFSDTTGTTLSQTSAAPVLEGDSRLTDARTPVTHTHAIADVTSLQASLDAKASDSATTVALATKQADTNEAWSARSTSTAADATYKTTFGLASYNALVSQVAATVLSQIGGLNDRAAFDGLGINYSSGSPVTLTAGQIPVFTGARLATGVAEVSAANTASITAVANAVPFSDGTGGIIMQPYGDGTAWELLDNSRPYATRSVSPVSNILTFNANDGRKVLVPTLNADTTISADCWANLTDNSSPIDLFTTIGATPYAITATFSTDGGYEQIDPTFSANSIQYHQLFKVSGVPWKIWRGEVITTTASAATVSFVGYAKGIAASGVLNLSISTVTTSGGGTASTQAGDLAVGIGGIGTTTAVPAIPTSQSVAWTNIATSGIGDANPPGVRHCYKVLASGDTTMNFDQGTGSGGHQWYVAVFRKTGTSPAVQTSTYNKTAATSTATLTWPAVTISGYANGYLLSHAQFLSTDTLTTETVLRTETPTLTTQSPSNTKSYLGISTLLNSATDTIGSTTSAKTGVAGRATSSQIYIA